MITITIDDAHFQRRTRQLLAALGPELPRALGDVGQNIIERTRANITAGRDWWGQALAPNSPVTIARKGGSRPLIATGTFVSTRLFHHVSGNVLTLGAGGVQAAVLHFGARKGQFGRTRRGAPIPWGDIPARPYMPVRGNRLAPAAEAEIRTSLEEHIESAGQ